MNDREGKEFVEGLARGLAVLEAFEPGNPEMTLSELARKTGHTPASVRRSLFTLEALGYLRRNGRRFIPSTKLLSIGLLFFNPADIEHDLMTDLRAFVDEFGDAASVGIISGRTVLYIAHCSAKTGLRPVARTGITYPAHATSMGRVLLAYAPERELDVYLSTPLTALTDQTVTDPGVFRQIITSVLTDGYATAVDQLALGVTSIAVPIRLPSGAVVAAVNSSGYTGRLTIDTLLSHRLDPLRQLASKLSSKLACYPSLIRSIGSETQS